MFLMAKKLVEQKKNKSITKYQSSHKSYEKVGSQLQGGNKQKKPPNLLCLILSPLRNSQ